MPFSFQFPSVTTIRTRASLVESLEGTVSDMFKFGYCDKRTVHADYSVALFGVCTLETRCVNVQRSSEIKDPNAPSKVIVVIR